MKLVPSLRTVFVTGPTGVVTALAEIGFRRATAPAPANPAIPNFTNFLRSSQDSDCPADCMSAGIRDGWLRSLRCSVLRCIHAIPPLDPALLQPNHPGFRGLA